MGTVAALLLVLIGGSPAFVRWASNETDPNTAGGWFMRQFAWPAWRFDEDETVENVLAADIKAILLIVLAAVFLAVIGGMSSVGQFFAAWGAYIFSASVAAFISAFVLADPSLLTAFQQAAGGATYGLFLGWIVGVASLAGYRSATTVVHD